MVRFTAEQVRERVARGGPPGCGGGGAALDATGDEVAQYICDNHTPHLWECPPLDEINVLNGIVDVRTGKLRPHSPSARLHQDA